MWGEDWGSMIWTAGALPVPMLSPFGLIGLAVLLACVGWTIQRSRRSAKVSVLMVLVVGAVLPLATFAAVSLPHVFVNGTVADATEVNANFQTLLAQTGRYTIGVFGGDPGVGIPAAAMAVCEDEDGCSLQIVRYEAATEVVDPDIVWRLYFETDPTEPRVWQLVSPDLASTVSGRDDDGSFTFIQELGPCVFTDGDPNAPADTAPGFSVQNTSGSPDVECRFTLMD